MIAAIVPAAGLSSRMGGPIPKPLLPWGQQTVIEQVVRTLLAGGIQAGQVIVVTGHRGQEIEAALAGYPVHCLPNPEFRSREMLSSLQIGLDALPESCPGALLALADQPQIQAGVVQQILQACEAAGRPGIVVPSYQMRRGHPILLPRRLWPEILALAEGRTLRSVIGRHASEIYYVVVDTPSVLADLDTPEQYRQALEEIADFV